MLRAKLRKIKPLKKGYRLLREFSLNSRDSLRVIYYKVTNQKVLYSYYARVNNFGDLFNIDLISFFGYKLIYTSDYKKSKASLLGSILQMYPQDFSGYVLGSGFIHKRFNRKINHWKVLLIRGPLSAEQCEAKECAFGDPGFLASLVYKDINSKKYKLGILPHSSDYDRIKKIDFGKGVKVITARKTPSEVAKDIMECDYIASSSLHGLIFADSYGIPNVHLKFGDKLIGGLHKFEDYYLGMGLNNMPKHIDYSNTLKTKTIIENCTVNFTNEIIKNKQTEIINSYNQFFRNLSLTIK